MAASTSSTITLITQQLKDLAIDFDCPVLAVSSADREGLEPGDRMRARHLRGSTALAYEPDVVMILAHQVRHRRPPPPGLRRRQRRALQGVGRADPGEEPQRREGADIEFRKRFHQGRFDHDGNVVAEKLVDERLYVECHPARPLDSTG